MPCCLGRQLDFNLAIKFLTIINFHKAFHREVIQPIPIEEDPFGSEPQITVKVTRRNLRIHEVGIGYWGRTYEEGKKIGWKDGMRALYCLMKYSIKEPTAKASDELPPTQCCIECFG